MGEAATEDELQAGRGYERLFVKALFGPWAAHVVRAADVPPGARVLDVACGTGVLARAARDAAGPDGHVTGLDPAPGMLAVAREIAPDIDWVLAPAEDTGLPDAAFDRVISQFGIMFFRDRRAALGEMRRVLDSGGRVALAAWSAVEWNPAYAEVAAILDDEVGRDAGDAVRLPFCLGDPDAVLRLLEEAGFADVSSRTLTGEARFPAPRTMVEAELRGWLPLFGIHLDEGRIESVLAGADERLRRFVVPSGEVRFTTWAHIATGTKA